MVSTYLYVPNLIGYGRIIFVCLAAYYAFSNWMLAVLLYSISMWLDAIDGAAARYFNQSSAFGQQLDMLTDRLSTLGLNFVLAIVFQEFWYVFLSFAVLDLASHWIHMICSVQKGSKTHKAGEHWFLRFYYTFSVMKIPALLILCVGQETWLLTVYCLGFVEYDDVLWDSLIILQWISLPFFVLKQFGNLVQLKEGLSFLVSLAELSSKL